MTQKRARLLTSSKAAWAKNRDVTLRGKPLNYNISQQIKYQKAILKLVRMMTTTTKKEITRLFESNTAESFVAQQKEAAAMDASIANQAKKLMKQLMSKFDNLFALKAQPLAEDMVKGAKKISQTNLQTSLKQLSGRLTLKTGVVPTGMEDIATATVSENVSLIKSIPSQYFNDVTGSVMRSITFGGEGLKTLIPEIQKYNGVTQRRAKNIALDQTRKAYNSINKQRMQAIGVKQFEWVHSGGGQHPRKSHEKISGHIFSFENLEKEQAALGVPEADRGIPGQAINCRCTINPVIRFDEGE